VAARGDSATREAPPSDPRPLDLNHADVEQIARLPGMGLALARRIVAAREQRGEFGSADDLRGVLGLGPKKIAALRELVMVGAGAGAPDAGRAPPEQRGRASSASANGAAATDEGARGAAVRSAVTARETADGEAEPSERCEGAECGPLPGDTR
jgi:competence protein ComEA